MKKTIIICSIILAVLICAGVAASAVFGVAAMRNSYDVRKEVLLLTDRVDDFIGKYGGEDVARENDVTIAGEYVIKSTESISDAYKSGKKLDGKLTRGLYYRGVE